MIWYVDYNGKEFVPIKVADANDDSNVDRKCVGCAGYFISEHDAVKSACESNWRLVKSFDDFNVTGVNSLSDIVVDTCRDCDKYFITSRGENEWFLDRHMTRPKRCHICRRKRRES